MSAFILRASDEDARRTSTSTHSLNSSVALTPPPLSTPPTTPSSQLLPPCSPRTNSQPPPSPQRLLRRQPCKFPPSVHNSPKLRRDVRIQNTIPRQSPNDSTFHFPHILSTTWGPFPQNSPAFQHPLFPAPARLPRPQQCSPAGQTPS